MDIDAALRDGYSIQEVNAEAARRVNFNYTQAKADGYTDDDILQELRRRSAGGGKKEETSAYKAAGKSALESTGPAMAGLAAGTAALSYGAPLIAGSGPAAPVTALALGLGGGLAGAIGAEKLQGAVTGLIPESIKEPLGFGEKQRALETQQHPYASFAGGLAPNLLAFRPGAVAPMLDAAGKQIMSPMAQRGAMAGIGGAVEAGQELYTEGKIDPLKVAMAAGFQGAATNPTKFGERFMGRFERPNVAKPKVDAMDADQKAVTPAVTETTQETTQRLESEYVTLQKQLAALKEQKQVPAVKQQIEQVREKINALDEERINQIRQTQKAQEESAFNAPEGASQYHPLVQEAMKQEPFTEPHVFDTGSGFGDLARATAEGTSDVRLQQEAIQEAARQNTEPQEIHPLSPAGEYADLVRAQMNEPKPIGEQVNVFEPHTNMHRAYEEMFVQDEHGVRPLSPTEFRETITNLAQEPGTMFKMPATPEEFKAMYQDYLNHPQGGQGDLFGAHQVLMEQGHKNWGDLTPHERGQITKALNKIGPLSEQMQSRMSVQEAAGNLVNAMMNASGGKMNFIPENTSVLGALRDLAVALFDAGHKTLRAASEQMSALFGDAWNQMIDKFNEIFKITRTEKMLSGETIPDITPAEQIIHNAVGESDGKFSTNWQSGATLTAMKTGSSLIKDVGRLVQNAGKRAELAVRNFVFPLEKGLSRLSSTEIQELAEVFKREAFNNQAYSTEVLEKHLSIKQLEAYAKAREMFEQSLAAQNVARQAKGQPLITEKEAYMSSRWQGAFRQPVRDSEGNLVWYLAADSKAGIKAQADALQREMPGLSVDYKEGHSVSLAGNKTDLQSAYSTMLDMLGRDDPTVQHLKKAIEELTQTETEFTRAQTKHFKQKSNIRGFVGDRPGHSAMGEAIALFEQQIQYAKNAFHWSEMQKIGDVLKDVLSNETLRERQPNNVAYAREYFKNALGQGQSQVTRQLEDAIRKGMGVSTDPINRAINNVKSYFILDKLAASAGYTMAQFIQLGNVLPYLTDLRAKGFAGNPVKAITIGAPTGMAMGFAHYLKATGHEYMNKLPDQFTKDMFLYAEENGVTTRSVYDESQLASSFTVGGQLGGALSKTLTIPDAFTRGVAFATYAHMLKDSGMYKDMNALFQHAEDLTNASMVDYRQTERPLAFSKLGTAGNVLNTLQTYPLNFYNQYSYMLREVGKGNIAPMIAALGVQYLAAGAMGVPYAEDTYKLFTWIKDNHLPADMWAEAQKYPFLKDPKMWAIDNLGRSAVYGWLSENTGIGLTSRVAAPGVSNMIQAPGGALVDVGKQAASVGKAIISDKPEATAQAIMDVIPVGLQGFYEMSPSNKGMTWEPKANGMTGVYKTSDVGSKDVVFDRTPEEVQMRRMTGLKSQREVVERDLAYQTKKTQVLFNEKGGELVDKAAVAYIKGDRKEYTRLNNLYISLKGTDITTDQLFNKLLEKKASDKQKLFLNSKNPRDIVEAAKLRARLESE